MDFISGLYERMKCNVLQESDVVAHESDLAIMRTLRALWQQYAVGAQCAESERARGLECSCRDVLGPFVRAAAAAAALVYFVCNAALQMRGRPRRRRDRAR